MSRLHTIDASQATGELAQVFGVIKKSIGKVPNAYATLGSNMPTLLRHALDMGAVLKAEGGLAARELEAINLAISEDSGCDYCVAAHTLTGQSVGLTRAETKLLRDGVFPEDGKIDALIKFCLRLVHTRGTVPESVLKTVREAGYSDQQIVGAIAATSSILLTNMLNRVNDTTLDFPRAE